MKLVLVIACGFYLDDFLLPSLINKFVVFLICLKFNYNAKLYLKKIKILLQSNQTFAVFIRRPGNTIKRYAKWTSECAWCETVDNKIFIKIRIGFFINKQYRQCQFNKQNKGHTTFTRIGTGPQIQVLKPTWTNQQRLYDRAQYWRVLSFMYSLVNITLIMFKIGSQKRIADGAAYQIAEWDVDCSIQ